MAFACFGPKIETEIFKEKMFRLAALSVNVMWNFCTIFVKYSCWAHLYPLSQSLLGSFMLPMEEK
jgi:hypothetical protein